MFRIDPRPIFACICLSATTAFAQGITIDDDGWSRAETSGSLDFMVDVDDDAFTRMAKPGDTMQQPFSGTGCTQLEMNMGLSGNECGKMTKAEAAKAYIGAHD